MSSSQQQADQQQNSVFRLLKQQEAQDLDKELMDEKKQGFSVDQLMEMAGMSCAHASYQVLQKSAAKRDQAGRRVLCIVGPGNNGGDGLVAARHLKHFGIEQVDLLIPRQAAEGSLYARLLLQCQHCGCSAVSLDDLKAKNIQDLKYDLVIDAIFGFSFDPSNGVREPYRSALAYLVQMQRAGTPVLAIDIPSGWHVERGPNVVGENFDESLVLQPQYLVSLTAPKLCASHFHGEAHFLGGRFVPTDIAERYGLTQLMKIYKGIDIIAELPHELK